jgi:hypothetical protein
LLRAGHDDYVINAEALAWVRHVPSAQGQLAPASKDTSRC